MKITNEQKTRVIELTKVAEEQGHYPSFEIAIHIQIEEITALFKRAIWLAEADVDDFINSLLTLEEYRQGAVELQSMSPNQFSLQIKAMDAMGHLAVGIRLEKPPAYHYYPLEYADKIEIQFEIDPTTIPAIVIGLRRIKTAG